MSDLRREAARLDDGDKLAGVRDRFVLDDSLEDGSAEDGPAEDGSPGVVYLDGNSLGALPRNVPDRLADVVTREWGRMRIRSWTESGWWEAPERVGDLIAPVIGAAPGQVVVGDSTSVNVFKALVGAVRLADSHGPHPAASGASTAGADRDEILVDAATFPTDGYIAESAARLTGRTVRPVHPGELAAAVGPRTAAVLLNQVDYRTGELHDLPALTSAAHAAGAYVVADLCHSAGALPVGVDEHGVDFAVGCSYKYLNGGPGAPAFLYLRREHQSRFDSPLPGWHSHRDPFGMASAYEPAGDVRNGRVGTPDILSMAALEAALDVWRDVDIADVRAKSLALTDFFLRCVDVHVPEGRLGCVTPREHDRRGSQISLHCDDAEPVMAELIARGVVGDHRRPGVLRFGFTPLYTSFTDVEYAARVLGEVVG
ncbi:kynureninase [Streptomyces sp. 549]|uniref:kynureninase n=1 Tax=Streptomyces sp. 549 TaxID=3049076 RepID=UPI0024C39197|nr:kynureninase [Streptomyces sp. 549]MDK1473084.1 kynureninase [Streptomyces sp. 549]